jgi:hypothetical protein
MEMISGRVVHFTRSHLLARTVQRDAEQKDVPVTKDAALRWVRMWCSIRVSELSLKAVYHWGRCMQHTGRSLFCKTTHSGWFTSCNFTGMEWAIIGSTQHFHMYFNSRYLSLVVMKCVNIRDKIYFRIYCLKIWGFHVGDYEQCRLLGCGAM